ncbi:MAG: hypothetical protein LBK23_05970 [Oscillospiraceae bacterium]|jgi:hypothetical protein|nr:hypothetical protein [Oscillospiraceae bacterium]
MPSMMIHLTAAYEYDADGDGLFYFANLAPDYTDARRIKDIIHLRDKPDRLSALAELKSTLDLKNPFELGWLLHLFADSRWDSAVIPKFRDSYPDGDGGEPWFTAYRKEIGRLSFALYRREPWAAEVFAKMSAAELDDTRALTGVLPVPLELGWFLERVHMRHERGGAPPEFFTLEMAEGFARDTARGFKEWLYG